ERDPRRLPREPDAVRTHPLAWLRGEAEPGRDLADPVGAERPADEAVAPGNGRLQRAAVPARLRLGLVHDAEELEVLAPEGHHAIGGADAGMHAAVEHGEAQRLHAACGRIEI